MNDERRWGRTSHAQIDVRARPASTKGERDIHKARVKQQQRAALPSCSLSPGYWWRFWGGQACGMPSLPSERVSDRRERQGRHTLTHGGGRRPRSTECVRMRPPATRSPPPARVQAFPVREDRTRSGYLVLCVSCCAGRPDPPTLTEITQKAARAGTKGRAPGRALRAP